MTTEEYVPEEWRGPESLRHYFLRAFNSVPDEQYLRAIHACDRWLFLMSDPKINQDDVDKLLKLLELDESQGEAWQSMSKQFKAWARKQGFKA